MAWIEQRGTHYRVRFRLPDGTVGTDSSHPTRAAAQIRRKQVGIDQAVDTYLDPAAGRITLAEWVAIWETGHLAGPAKTAAYRSHLRIHILPRFGRVPLTQINRHAVKVFVKHLKTQLADSSVTSVMVLFGMLMREAVAERRIGHNPCHNIRITTSRPPERPHATPAQRGIGYIVQVKGDALAHTPEVVPVQRVWSGRGRPPTRTELRYPDTAVSLVEHVNAAGRDAAVTLTWRERSKGAMSSQFIFLRVRPAGHRVARDSDGLLPERWLIAQWPHDEDEPVKYWLSSLPADTDPADLIRHGKIRWRIEHDYRELKTGLGLDHFEGRSWLGWHRHVTLVTAAHLFITMLRHDPKAAAPA
jgi:hypothetical protein